MGNSIARVASVGLVSVTIVMTCSVFGQPPAKTAAKPNRREVSWVNPKLPNGPGLTHHVLKSKSLDREVGYVVWTPSKYSANTVDRFPVIYFLHGLGGTESADAAGFSGWVAKAIERGLLPPVLCIFPNGGTSFYQGEVESMIIDELIPLVDKEYRTLAQAQSRALAGFSMGGSGSAHLAIMHPELFCAAGSLGGFIRGETDKINSAIDKAIPVWKQRDVGFFLVNGDQDRPDAFRTFAERLGNEGICHEVLILPATSHNLGLYYERSVEKLLTFIGKRIRTTGDAKR